VGGAYMEVTRPDKALYYTGTGDSDNLFGEAAAPLSAPWRVPSPAELAQIRAALQTTGKADYGDYWYASNKVTVSMAPQGEPVPGFPAYRIVLARGGGSYYNRTFVRLKDGATKIENWEADPYWVSSEHGTSPGRVIFVRSFDPSQPPATVPAGKPVAPPLPVLPPCKYEVGGKGPKGGIVYSVEEIKGYEAYWCKEVFPEIYHDQVSQPDAWAWYPKGAPGSALRADDMKLIYNRLLKTGKANFGDGWVKIQVYQSWSDKAFPGILFEREYLPGYFNLKTGALVEPDRVNGDEFVFSDPEMAAVHAAGTGYLVYRATSVEAY
jgi:hypothetical protein